MPRSKKIKNKKSKPKTIPVPKQVQKPRSFLSTAKVWILQSWKILSIVALLVGLVSSLLVFASRVSVSSSSPLNPSDPFSTPFYVSNDGLFAIYDVTFYCNFRDVTFFEGGSISGISVRGSDPLIPSIEASERATTKCLLTYPDANRNDHGDIVVVVSYKPKFLPYRKERKFRFVMEQGSDKQWRWQPEPVSKQLAPQN
ncbi:MAG: hypothetical protein M3388_19610 [Acidobacteriota bacterium]|nr:hypothetical protein [Acidobacteriota bacterium]